MGADLPDEADEPDGRADRHDDQAASNGQSARGSGVEAEPRTREEYYVDLRIADSAQKSATARQITAEEQAASQKWDEKVEESRWMWTEYQRRFPPEDRPQPDRSDDEKGSWREGDRYLERANNERVEAACDQIATREEEKLTPAMRAIESQDPDRHLTGLEHSRKGRDRIKEKVADRIKEKNRTLEEAVSLIPDTIRYTFQYEAARYTQGVWADITRMKEHGFKLIKCKNSWEEEQYRGINSQWIEPNTGQRFELQFHTRISFEAKQLTHDAYKRLRTKQADAFEELVLEAFQRKVTAEVPVPLGAADIPDYPERGADAR